MHFYSTCESSLVVVVPFMWFMGKATYFQGFVSQFLHDKKYSLIFRGHDSKQFEASGHRPRPVFFQEPGRSIYLVGWATTIISRRNLGSIGFETVDIRMIQKRDKRNSSKNEC